MTNFAERQYPQPGPTPPPDGTWGKPRSKQVTWYDPATVAAGADRLSGDSGMLTATGRVTKPGRRIALATAEITDAAGRLVATASSNGLLIQPPG